MATVLTDITGDVHTLIDGLFDVRKTKVYARHNTAYVVDADEGVVRLGSATVSIGTDGTFTLPDVVADADTVENLQATVVVDYVDPASRQRVQQSFGPYDLTAESGTVDIADLEEVQALDASRSSVLMAEMEALRDGIVGDLGTTDSQTATLVSSPSLTQTALSASFAGMAAPPTGVAATDTAAIQAAIDALPDGGVIRLHPGGYVINDTIDLTSHHGITIEGSSPQFGGPAELATWIEYTASGTDAIFDCTGAIGVAFRRLVAFYSHDSFTGTIIDGTGTQHLSVEDCSLSGKDTAASAESLVYLDECTQATFVRTNFNSAVNGVRAGAGALGTQIITFRDCTFGHSGGGDLSLSGFAICNPNRTWVFDGCNFEASSTGYPNALGYDGGISYGEAIGFFGCWFGDISASAVPTAWIDYDGASRVALTLIGNNVELGNVHSFVKFGKSVAQEGLSAHGNFFYGAAPNPVDIAEYATGVDIDGNRYAGGSPAGANLDRSRAFKYAMGAAGGNITTTSGTGVDVAAGAAGAALSLQIAARPGDVLDIEFTTLWSHSAVGQAILLYLLVAGTVRMTTVDTYTGAFSLTATVRCQRVVAAGDISSGLVTVKPQWATTAGTAQIGNTGTVIPSFSVVNRGR